MSDEILAAALALATRGWPVHPLRGKVPLVRGWPEAASVDPETIRAWWGRWPEANLGLATGARSGLDVLDLDGAKGSAWLEAQVATHGPLPATVAVETGSGGRHLYFARDPERPWPSRAKQAPGVDTRGDGGNLVAPPSVHASGGVYRWLPGCSPDEVNLARAPEWLVDFVLAPRPAPGAPPPSSPRPAREPGARAAWPARYVRAAVEAELARVAQAVEGGRNAALNVAAFALGQLEAGGAQITEEVWALLHAAAITAGLEPRETGDTIRSGRTAGAAAPRDPPSERTRSAPPPTGPPPGPSPPPPPPPPPGDGTHATPEGDADGDAGGRPTILVTLELAQVRDEAESALVGREVYVHAGRLAKVVPGARREPPRVHAIQPPDLKATLSAAAVFVARARTGTRRSKIPGDVVAALHSRGEWPRLPSLDGISQSPILRPDGSVALASGYDPASGIYLDLPPGPIPVVPAAPTRDDARAALAVLAEPYEEFPFSASHDLSAALAFPLTLLARGAYDDATPLWVFGAPEAGTGKSLVARVGTLLATGREPALLPPAEREEQRKQIDALALAGVSLVLLDNVTSIGGGYLAAAVTAPRMEVRELGRSSSLSVRPPVVAATGNNPEIKQDMRRRVIPCFQNADSPRPDQRAFRRPRLARWVLEHRARLLGAGLTILRAFVLAGSPGANDLEPWGSFEAWSALVRAALVWVGAGDPCAGRDAVHETGDHGEDALGDLLRLWSELPRLAQPVTARTLLACAADLSASQRPELAEALTGACRKRWDQIDAEAVGYTLRRSANRVVDGREPGSRLRLVAGPKTREGGRLWEVKNVNP